MRFTLGLPLLFLVIAICSYGSELDSVTSKSDVVRQGKVLSVDATTCRMSMKLDGDSTGSMTISIVRKDIAKIVFAPDPALDKQLAAAEPTILVSLWEKWKLALDLPETPAPRIGLAYANSLLEKEPSRALEIFKLVEETAWSSEARTEARGGRLRAMIEMGQIEEAQREAKEFAQSSDDPSAIIRSKHILAITAFQALKKLIEENPRWQEDIFVVPVRNRLYNEALDNFLYAPLFFGDLADTAAAGLQGAIEVYRFCGENSRALECARDIVKFYPTTTAATDAQKFIQTYSEPTATHL